MKVELISYSKNDKNDSIEDIVAFCARVSNPANQNNKDTNEKLIRYLIENNHWSPLEMVSICLEIETTRDIARQILRHRSFSFQEFSQRYAVADLGFVNKEARLQDTKNRQNSIEIEDDGDGDGDGHGKGGDLQKEWMCKQDSVNKNALEAYKWALTNGIAKEQARSVLPEGTTVSRMYMNGTLRSWVHYIQLRTENGTQKEHKLVAIACAESISKIFPMIKEFISA